jgi:hypothetical protein
MALHAKLELKILGLCEEANAMLLANLLDTKKASLLRKRLLDCGAQARDAGHETGEWQMTRAEAELAARFLPADE